MQRRQVKIEGIVQGVGFRPFVYRIATERNLSGTVYNNSQGVKIEVEGRQEHIDSFLRALNDELPPLAAISRMETVELAIVGESGFSIINSKSGASRSAEIAPDTHVCSDCLKELFDPSDRRYRYPFINCTNCGPRYSIVTNVPYDRPLTTMADFPMCPDCLQEYQDPLSRRFHAQPIACAACGPQLSFYDAGGVEADCDEPLQETIKRLKQGDIVAIKGLGGYHLAVDANNDSAVERLRQRKHRDEKPFAVMAYSVDRVKRFAKVDVLEERMLTGPERPILLLEKIPGTSISRLVAPRNRYFGVMLPYTPLHFLLLEQFPALVMTSGNQSDEPIAFEDADAINRLEGIADAYLVHNRRIHIRTDDSIVRALKGEPLMLRRSRGYVPRGVLLPQDQFSVLAVGAELKNTICLSRGDRAYLSQHIGDLKNQEVVNSLQQSIDHLQGILDVKPTIVAHDLHPDYLSTNVATSLNGMKKVAVQHHHAHLASCMADNGVTGETIGVIFDGIGYGSDGHIWGGEFLLGDYSGFRRVGQFDYVSMPGGDAATREPWRMAISYLMQAFGDDIPESVLHFETDPAQLKLLKQMIQKGINSPLTSSCGRLFDAVAALAGVRDKVSYEGQAALELEMVLQDDAGQAGCYPFEIRKEHGLLVVSAVKMIQQLISDLRNNVSKEKISARFHNGLVKTIVDVCVALRVDHRKLPVALSGGVFQNRYLTERAMRLLKEDGFEVLVHRQVPPNDGGLSLGQAVIAGHLEER